jgi:hypothetical protein
MSTSRIAALSSGCVAVAALLLGGCKQLGATGGCPVAGDCGGDPVGVWQVDPALTCNFPVVSRPVQNYVAGPYFEPETGATPPAVTSGSWCWDLAFDKDGTLLNPATPMQAPDYIVGGTFTFTADHSYTYALTATSTTTFHVAKSCFGVNAANLTCDAFATELQATIGANTAYSNPNGGPSFVCHDAGDGCTCTFDYLEIDSNDDAVGDKGTWVQDGNVIHHYSNAGQGNLNDSNPARRTVRDATFCVTDGGQTLQISGTNGQALALKTGSRSLTLTRVTPDAGMAEPDATTGATDTEAPDVGAAAEVGTDVDAGTVADGAGATTDALVAD